MTNSPPAISKRLPWTVQAAAGILAIYGVGVLVNATIQQGAIGWGSVEPRGFGRAVIRFLGMGLIAWGLWKGARWAWWVGVLLLSFFILAGGFGLSVFLRFRGEVPEGFSIPSMEFVIASFVGLAVALILLLLPTSRSVFKRPAA